MLQIKQPAATGLSVYEITKSGSFKRLSSPNASIGDMVFQAITNQIPDYPLGNDRIGEFCKRLKGQIKTCSQ